MNSLARLIVAAADRRGLSHRELGELAGINARTIDRIWSGVSVPHESTTRRLAQVLDLNVDEVLAARERALDARGGAGWRDVRVDPKRTPGAEFDRLLTAAVASALVGIVLAVIVLAMHAGTATLVELAAVAIPVALLALAFVLLVLAARRTLRR